MIRIRLPFMLALAMILAVSWTLTPGSSFSQEKADKEMKAAKEGKAGEKVEALAEVGKKAPDFTLTDTEGNTHKLADYLKEEKVVVLEWFNPDCPFVKKHHKDNKSMSETFAAASEHEVVWLAINSGGKGKQGAGLERNKKAIEDYGIAYPVLLDEEGKVGKMYGAKTTPHMFLINKDGTLIYTGAIDNVPSPAKLGDVNYVKKALGECVSGKKVETSVTKSYGCSVKYAT